MIRLGGGLNDLGLRGNSGDGVTGADLGWEGTAASDFTGSAFSTTGVESVFGASTGAVCTGAEVVLWIIVLGTSAGGESREPPQAREGSSSRGA